MNEHLHKTLAEQWEAAMIEGDFVAAFGISDRVLALRDRRTRDDPLLPYHMRWVWDGRSFDGKQVLVRCYHGLGDTVQFCRYLPALRNRVRHLTLEVQPELIPLLSSLAGPHQLLAFRPEQPHPASECDIEIMELAHALRRAPSTAPYLGVNAPMKRRTPLRVGLCWRAGATWSPERSLPPELVAPLMACDGVEIVSLQPGAATVPGLRDDCPASIVQTARRIAQLDLVISVDSMVAHLCGAVGTPLWLLLKAEPDWRWRAGGSGSVWYRQVRKYRQPRAGEWETPIASVINDLNAVRGRRGTLLTASGCCAAWNPKS